VNDTLSLVILNSFQDPAGLGALSRDILKPVQYDDSLIHDGAAGSGF